MRLAVYAGTFDPVTRGHLSVIARAAQLFDRVEGDYFSVLGLPLLPLLAALRQEGVIAR